VSLNKEFVQRQFDQAAIHYDRLASMQRSIVDQLLLQVNTGLQHAVDLGCGTGYGLVKLSERGPVTLTGLDLAPGMLRIAEEAAPEAELVQGDIEALPFAGNSFDLTLSSSAIQWCDLIQALSEIVRVTRPGGRVVLSTFVDGTLRDWRELWQLPEQQRFVGFDDLECALRLLSITQLQVWRHTFSNRFYCFESAVRSIRDLGAGNAGQQKRKGLLGRHRYQNIKNQIEQNIDQQGYIELQYKVAFADFRVTANGHN
jgi:malonyl-CoA O-methyltransferase